MLPRTLRVFHRSELEKLTYANLLNSVWAKTMRSTSCPTWWAWGARCCSSTRPSWRAPSVNPRSFTTLDAVLEGASKLVAREGPAITRAGLLVTQHAALNVYHWVLDQGGKFYDEKTHRWTWETVEAERALQWIIDTYDKHRYVAGGPLRDPGRPGRRAATMMGGAFRLSDYALQYPDVKIADLPLPSFVPGKPRNYYMPEIAGFSLPILKPDEPKAKLGGPCCGRCTPRTGPWSWPTATAAPCSSRASTPIRASRRPGSARRVPASPRRSSRAPR